MTNIKETYRTQKNRRSSLQIIESETGWWLGGWESIQEETETSNIVAASRK